MSLVSPLVSVPEPSRLIKGLFSKPISGAKAHYLFGSEPPLGFTMTNTGGSRHKPDGIREAAATNTPNNDHVYNAASGLWEPIGCQFYGPQTQKARATNNVEDATFWGKWRLLFGDTTAGPDGTQSLKKIIADTTSSTHTFTKTFSYAAEYIYMAVDVKASEYNRFQLYARDSTFQNFFARFDVSSGTVVSSGGTTGTVYGSGIVPLGGGIFRCWVLGTVNSGTATIVHEFQMVNELNSNNFTGDGTSGIYVGNVDIFYGSITSNFDCLLPHVPNTGTSSDVTKTGDTMLLSGLQSMPWFNPRCGTIMIDFWLSGVGSVNNSHRIFEAIKDTNNRLVLIYNPTTSGSKITAANFYSGVNVGGTPVGPTADPRQRNRAFISYNSDTLLLKTSINGGAVSSFSVGGFADWSFMRFGSSGSGNYPLQGSIPLVAYYPEDILQ